MAWILHNHIALMKIGEVTCRIHKCFVIHCDPDDFSQFTNTTFEVFSANNTPTGLTNCEYNRSNQQLLCWLLLLWSLGHDLCFPPHNLQSRDWRLGYSRGHCFAIYFSVFLPSYCSQKLLNFPITIIYQIFCFPLPSPPKYTFAKY